jgi:uncharacterized protein (TIGR04255 family)
VRLDEIDEEILSLRLDHPPLRQAIYELRFPMWKRAQTRMVEFHARVGERFSGLDAMELTAGPDKKELGWSFLDAEAGDRVSISPSVLNFNTARYRQFDDFRHRVDSVCHAFDQTLREGRDITRIAVRAINNITQADIERAQVPLENIVDMPLGPAYPPLTSFSDLVTVSTYRQADFTHIDRVGLVPKQGAHAWVYFIDIEVARDGMIPWQRREEFWEALHRETKITFLRHLKRDALKTVFGGRPK